MLKKMLSGFGQIKLLLLILFSIFFGVISGSLVMEVSFKFLNSEILQVLLGLLVSHGVSLGILVFAACELCIKELRERKLN